MIPYDIAGSSPYRIEEEMRITQERWFAVKGTYITWPAANPGGATANYPANGWYDADIAAHVGYPSSDHRRAALIQAIMDTWTDVDFLPKYVNGDTSDVEGASSIPVFSTITQTAAASSWKQDLRDVFNVNCNLVMCIGTALWTDGFDTEYSTMSVAGGTAGMGVPETCENAIANMVPQGVPGWANGYVGSYPSFIDVLRLSYGFYALAGVEVIGAPAAWCSVWNLRSRFNVNLDGFSGAGSAAGSIHYFAKVEGSEGLVGLPKRVGFHLFETTSMVDVPEVRSERVALSLPTGPFGAISSRCNWIGNGDEPSPTTCVTLKETHMSNPTPLIQPPWTYNHSFNLWLPPA